MTNEKYLKKWGIKTPEDYQKKLAYMWEVAKEVNKELFEENGIETLEQFREWYKTSYKGIPIGIFVSPLPKEVLDHQ